MTTKQLIVIDIDNINSSPSKTDPEKILVCKSDLSLKATQKHINKQRSFKPQFIISSLGTEILDCQSNSRITKYEQTVSERWNQKDIDEFITPFGLQKKEEMYQGERKNCYQISSIVEYQAVYSRLKYFSWKNWNFKVVQSKKDELSIIPQHASEHTAIQFLCGYLKINTSNVIAIGSYEKNEKILIPPITGILIEKDPAAFKNFENSYLYISDGKNITKLVEKITQN